MPGSFARYKSLPCVCCVHLELQFLSTCLAPHKSSVATICFFCKDFYTLLYARHCARFGECSGEQDRRVTVHMHSRGREAGTENKQTKNRARKIEGDLGYESNKIIRSDRG